MSRKKQEERHWKCTGYTSVQCAEVYLGKTSCNFLRDRLPFRADKFPQTGKEAK